MKIYNVLGKEIASMENEVKLPGSYCVDFNPEGLPSGVYYYRLTAGNFSAVKKMILLK
ncbi:MAG: T9SS C-terminal target domain-containing protein [Ignavibacteriales bacterium]|nr:MAG: T9SS C-terminal target domain-containing protein [Ignavibacteriales bacterium]